MAELRNAQRISYKATYNQISPTVTVTASAAGGKPSKLHVRALDKAAFVQSLQITPDELDRLRKQLPSRGGTDFTSALRAIQQLIEDKTAASTLNSAAAFAPVNPSDLVAMAKALMTYRQGVSASISKAIAAILSAYRGALTPSTSTASKPAPAAKLPKNATRTTSIANSGLPIITATTPIVPKGRRRDASKVETRGSRIEVSVDDSSQLPSGFSSVLAMGPGELHRPSNTAAIAWAEKFAPALFTTLVNQLQPYLGMSVDERNALGSSTAVSQLLQANEKAIFAAGSVKGAINGFQSRMEIEPVGNLHLERIEMYPAGVERGELLHSVPMAPGETVNISHKEWSVTEKEFEDIPTTSNSHSTRPRHPRASFPRTLPFR
jgi:hypothetical protein